MGLRVTRKMTKVHKEKLQALTQHCLLLDQMREATRFVDYDMESANFSLFIGGVKKAAVCNVDESPLFPVRMSSRVWMHGDSNASQALAIAPADALATKSIGEFYKLSTSIPIKTYRRHVYSNYVNQFTCLQHRHISVDDVL